MANRKRMTPKICKYCGNEYSSCGSGWCEKCREKVPLLPRYKEARDYLRKRLGLERMDDSKDLGVAEDEVAV